MTSLTNIWDSPELFPTGLDVVSRRLSFVRMTPATYRNSVFLDRRSDHLDNAKLEVRLDDLIVSSASMSLKNTQMHFILHPTFSCSTLLARYFELIPSSLVLKEPALLTQLSLLSDDDIPDWDLIFDISLKLCTRRYLANDFVVIKTHEPFNRLALMILQKYGRSTMTFLTVSLANFIVSILKSPARREWARSRVSTLMARGELRHMSRTRVGDLTDWQAAAFLWIANRDLWRQVKSAGHGGRALVVSGEAIADTPLRVVKDIFAGARVNCNDYNIDQLVAHPLAQRYSKNLTLPFNNDSRQEELELLRGQFKMEIEEALKWVSDCGAEIGD